jgi:hypothetical protein
MTAFHTLTMLFLNKALIDHILILGPNIIHILSNDMCLDFLTFSAIDDTTTHADNSNIFTDGSTTRGSI